MPFADADNSALLITALCTGLAAVIASAGSIVMQLFALYRENRNRKWDLEDKARMEAKQDHQAKTLVAELQSNTAMTEKTAEATAATAVAVGATAEAVEEVRHATNSLTDRLVDKTEKEGVLRGGVEERARADAREKGTAAAPSKPMTLIKSIEAIPEKTAEKVIEKLAEKGNE